MLKGKKIIVAGAAGLIGSRVVEDLLAAGAQVVAADVSIDSIHKKLQSFDSKSNNSALSFEQIDLTNEKGVKLLFDQMSSLDGAVNCCYPRNKDYGESFFNVSYDSFTDNVSLHLGAFFLFSQQCATYFKRCQTPFSLVNLSSIYGFKTPDFSIYEGTKMTMPVEYAAIKAAILHLDKYITAYVGDSRFRINSVSPGGILDAQADTFIENYQNKTQGKGLLNATDITGAIKFLLSDQSQFITGQNIIVDDGFSL